jgi:tetratricopeptide (TPR) repeat protein
VIQAAADEAESLLDAGAFEHAREAALRGLTERPDDVGLLRVAGKASAELDLEDATTYLRQAVDLEPENADAWRDLAEAFLYRNRLSDAMEAIRQAVELQPEEGSGLVDLGLSAYASGQVEEAVSYLTQAVERDPGSVAARRALVDVLRAAGRPEEALKAAEHLLQLEPDDVLATLDVAELSLELGRPEAATAEFARLGAIDEDPEHEVYAFHGMIQAAIQRENWRRALDLAIEATRVDRLGRTTDLLAYVVTRVFGDADRPAPSRQEVDEALAASIAEHRRLHMESLVV